MEPDALEIWMIAGLLLAEYGGTAPDIAHRRAGKALSEADPKAHATWRAVSEAAIVYIRSNPAQSWSLH